jgi:hypothetical protein
MRLHDSDHAFTYYLNKKILFRLLKGLSLSFCRFDSAQRIKTLQQSHARR